MSQVTCENCGRWFKNRAGLAAHQRFSGLGGACVPPDATSAIAPPAASTAAAGALLTQFHAALEALTNERHEALARVHEIDQQLRALKDAVDAAQGDRPLAEAFNDYADLRLADK